MSKITFKRSDGSEVPGLAYGVAGNPGVIAIQEWWGIDDEIKAHAEKLATDGGYRVIVPDLYRGKLGVEAEEAHHLMSNLDWPGAVEDIRAAALHLKGEGSAKAGATGFCMGGALALAAGVRVSELSAVAPFYGIPGDALANPAEVKVPVQGHYGAKDAMAGFSDPAAVDALEAKLKASGQPFELHRYATVGHAFMNATPAGIERRLKLGQGEHDQAAVDLAWSRLFAFFAAHLKA